MAMIWVYAGLMPERILMNEMPAKPGFSDASKKRWKRKRSQAMTNTRTVSVLTLGAAVVYGNHACRSAR